MNVRDLKRFLAKARLDDGARCWEWTATLSGGYGMFWLGEMRGAHRVAYEHFVGPVPDGSELDHLCRVRHCVNPWHLEPVTHQENARRGAAGSWQRTRTHCPAGHSYDDTNTYLYKGFRACRTCRQTAARRYQERNKRNA